MGKESLRFFNLNGDEITNLCHFVNRKSNPFGWSSADIEYEHQEPSGMVYEKEIIAFYESGDITMLNGFTYKTEEL